MITGFRYKGLRIHFDMKKQKMVTRFLTSAEIEFNNEGNIACCLKP
jgi:hypothetical protein